MRAVFSLMINAFGNKAIAIVREKRPAQVRAADFPLPVNALVVVLVLVVLLITGTGSGYF